MAGSEALDVAWILVAAALVMVMQAGFSSLESGLVRSKNSINVAAKNFSDFLVSSAIFWLFGFALMFGTTAGGLVGTDGLFFDGGTPFAIAFFVFQMGFAGAAATIVSGAVAERMRFSSYLIVTAIVAAVLYPVFGHWVWAGTSRAGGTGWLEDLGFIDFAGSTVVHSVGGWTALAALLVIGPRRGRFGAGAVPFHGHDLPLVTVGVFILWFGWFGFNGGSTLGFTSEVPSVILHTMLSGAFGGLAALALTWWRKDRPDVATVMNGALAGLVGITASANIVEPASAVVIGAVAAAAMYATTELLIRARIDDAVGAVPVHLAGGIWGTMAVAIFGNAEVFGEGVSRAEQLGRQLIGVGTAFVWVFGVGYVLLRLVDRFHPLRIDPDGEREGLNIAEHGASTEIVDLLVDMDTQRVTGDYSRPVRVEPHTEVGQIARQYNRVLDGINEAAAGREAALVALREKSDALELLQTITAAVNRELHLERAYRIALSEVCGFMGWPVGHVYAVTSDGATLTPTEIWQLPDEPAFARFRSLTTTTRIPLGAGLVGGCASTKAPAQVRLPEPSGRFVRAEAAAAAGLRAGFAFPVLAGDDVVAVLEFFTNDPDEQLDDSLLDLMASVGTQLGRAVERRRADEARFRTVVDHMPALVMLRDLDGRFLLANRRYEEFYGVAGDAVQGRTLREVGTLFGAPVWFDETEAHDREVLASNRASEIEIEVEVGGRTAVLASIKFPIPGPDGVTVALGGIEVDITERKEHEQELAALLRRVELAREEAERATRAKSHFLASVSHELRTPMNAIIGFTRLVSRKTSGQIDEVQHDNLGKVLTSAEHLMMLINDLLDLSRIEAGKLDVHPTQVDVAALVDDVVDMLQPLAATRSLSLTAETAPDLAPITTDGDRLRQILVNLVGNALKFTEHGGVRVEARTVHDQVELRVIDTGIGIAADHLERIFDEFEQVETGATRQYGGTGLGLTISNRLTQLLGGAIGVESTPGEGSTFTVTAPTLAPTALEKGAGR